MSEEHRVSRKEQERRKGWIGIIVWILAVGVLAAIIHFARSIGTIEGTRHYIYFEDSVAGLLKNSKVKYRGVVAGSVVSISLTDTPKVLSADGTKVMEIDIPLLSPVVQVEIAIKNEQVALNRNSRAFLKTNPLSGMQQIDINDVAGKQGGELQSAPEGGLTIDLYAGGVDLSAWIDVTIDSHKAGLVTAIDFTPGDELLAHVQIVLPYRFRQLPIESYVAWADSSVSKGRATINLVQKREEGVASYALARGSSPQILLVELPAAALAIDPVVGGEYASTPGGAASKGAMVSRLEQGEVIGQTGAQVKFLRVFVTGAIEPTEITAGARFTRWLAPKRSLTEGKRYFKTDILHEGSTLPPGAPIDVARSPLAVLMERADVLIEAIDYLPSIARNIEEAAANVVNITSDLREGAITDLRGAITENSEKLAEAIDSLRDGLLTNIEELGRELKIQVQRIGDTTTTKIEAAFPEETIANLKKIAKDVAESTENWKEGIAAAKSTFVQAKDIVGFKGEDGKTLAETVDTLNHTFSKLDETLSDNATSMSQVIKSLEQTLGELEKLISELRSR